MVRRIVRLIRHEKTQANVERRYIGHTDEGILQQVTALALKPTLVYGSDLRRCVETAVCYFPQASYRADARLRELDFGDFEMKTYEELKDDLAYRAWIDAPFRNSPPNGESFQTFQARVMEAFHEVTDAEATFVVHGGVIQMMLSVLLARPFYEVQAQHRTLYTLEEGEDGWTLLSAVPITVNELMLSNY